MKKFFGTGDKQKSSGFYGLSNTKKGLKSTFNATMKAKMKQLGVKNKGNR